MDKQKVQEKLENFWYYYKWYVIGGLVLVIMLIVGIRSCTLKTNPDLYVLFAVDRSPNSLLVRETEDWLGSLTEDVNGDGEATAQLLTTTTTDQWNGYNSAAMLVQVNSGKAILYILTDDTYATLHENGVLQDLTAMVGESPYLEGDRYCITASGNLDHLGGFAEEQPYYLCVRKVEGTTFEGEERYETQLRLAENVLKYMVENETK